MDLKDEIKKGLEICNLIYNQTRPVNSKVVEVWFRIIGHLPPDWIGQAFKRHLASSPYYPCPANIMSAVTEIATQALPPVTEAWAIVKELAKYWGPHSMSQFKIKSESIREQCPNIMVVAECIGWERISTTPTAEQGYLYRDFVKAWQDKVTTGIFTLASGLSPSNTYLELIRHVKEPATKKPTEKAKVLDFKKTE